MSGAIDTARRASAARPEAQRWFRAGSRSESAGVAMLGSDRRFAACVAHELRTPLATQRAILELSLADPAADWREIAGSMLRACEQQERLLEACLSFARSEHRLVHRGQVDLTEIAAGAVRAHDAPGIERLVSLEPAWTAGDPALLERLVANLVANAVRHNVHGGRIELATYTRAERAVLAIANTGPLVANADLPRLFEPFARLHSGPRSPGDGVGLGLAIVEAIALAHRARLAARARSGGGLEIRVSFRALPTPANS